MKFEIPKIGMRNIKTAISVFLCLMFFEIINRPDPVLAAIAAIMCMKSDVDNSLQAGISRTVGTIIGALIAILLLQVINSNIIDDLYIFIIPIGMIFLIEICVLLKSSDSVSICCVVYLSIMLNLRNGGDYWEYSINRVIDTAIGIIIAVIINKFFKTPKILKKEDYDGNIKSDEIEDVKLDIIVELNDKVESINLDEVSVEEVTKKNKEDDKDDEEKEQ